MRSILLSTLAGLLFLLSSTAVPAEKSDLTGVVNVNTTNAAELQLLPGIGPARAQAILAYRKKASGFKKGDELIQIDGVGERALSKIRRHCTTEGKNTARLTEM